MCLSVISRYYNTVQTTIPLSTVILNANATVLTATESGSRELGEHKNWSSNTNCKKTQEPSGVTETNWKWRLGGQTQQPPVVNLSIFGIHGKVVLLTEIRIYKIDVG